MVMHILSVRSSLAWLLYVSSRFFPVQIWTAVVFLSVFVPASPGSLLNRLLSFQCGCYVHGHMQLCWLFQLGAWIVELLKSGCIIIEGPIWFMEKQVLCMHNDI